MPNENPPRKPKSVLLTRPDTSASEVKANEARASAEALLRRLATAYPKSDSPQVPKASLETMRQRGVARIREQDETLLDRASADGPTIPPVAMAIYEETRTDNDIEILRQAREQIEAQNKKLDRQPQGDRTRFSESAPRPEDRAFSTATVEGWRKMLEEIIAADPALKIRAEEIARSTHRNNRKRLARRYFSPDDGERAKSFDDVEDGFSDMDSRGQEARLKSEQWLRELEDDDSNEPTERIVIEEGSTQVSEGRVGDDRTMPLTEKSERLRDAQAEVARAVGARSSEATPGGSQTETTGNPVLDRVLSEAASPTLVPADDVSVASETRTSSKPVAPKEPEKPRGVRGWARRVGYALGLLSTLGAGVGMYETMKGNAPSGVDAGDDPNQIALFERGDTADSADSADSGDTADSAVDSVDSTDTGALESGDSSTTETAESGDTAVDSGGSNSSIDSRDSGDTADSSVDSTDSFDSGETASDSFTRGGTGEYRQDTADSGDSADSSDSRDSSGDTGLESGNETGDSGDSFRDSQDSARDSIDSFQDTNGDTGFDSADSADSGDSTESGDSSQDSTLDSTDSTDSFDSGDSADSFRDTRGGTGIDSADTALDSADSGVDSTDSTDTGSLDSTDSGNSRDSFGGTGFDTDSSDSADTMFYGGTGFTGTDSGDSQGMDSSDSFGDSGDSSISSETAHSGDSGDTADTAANGMVQPEIPPAPTIEVDTASVETENIVRTRIENGEGISQAMLRLGIPIETITQALDHVDVVVGNQVNSLRNMLIDASEAKGNQLGMNIIQNPDGTIRTVEFFSVDKPGHTLTGSEMADLAHFDALSPMKAERQIHTLEDQLDNLEPGTEIYYSPLVIRIAEEGGAVQVRHITDGEHYYELTPNFLSVLGVDFTKYDKNKKEFLHEVPEAPLTRRLFRELAAKEGISPISR